MPTRAIILVAGISSRIQEVTKGRPKCFLPVGDETLLERSIRIVRAAGVTDITLVTGFMEHLFREAFPECHFVHNADYKGTNTSVSLKLALTSSDARSHAGDGSVLVLNGDIYYDDQVIGDVLAREGETVAAVKRHPLTDEEIKVLVEGDRITRIGKYLNEDLSYGEAFGVYLLDPRFCRYLTRELSLLHNPKIFYEAGMDRLLAGGHVMKLHDVGDALVQEIDFASDYHDLLELLAG